MQDLFGLQRFIDAQDPVYARVVEELTGGRKHSHWMWFIFPQVAGLGFSAMAQRYAIGSTQEAIAYLNHPLLGERLLECTRLVNRIQGVDIGRIFPRPDDLKFRSSMTLFASVAGHRPVFEHALWQFYEREPDTLTLSIVGKEGWRPDPASRDAK